MKFSNKIEAIAFIDFSSIPTDEKITLTRLIEEHALDREIKVIGSDGEITSLLFEADHDVESYIELDTAIIDVHSLAGVSSVTNQSKENIMSAQNQTAATAQQLNDMEAMIAASMKKIMESSLDGILEAALTKQQARIEETVKKTVDEAVKKAVDEAAEKAVKKAMEEAAKAAPKAEEAMKTAPKAETKEAPKADDSKKAEEPKKAEAAPAKASEEGMSTMAKTAAYLAGAAAIATGGYFAWQKWGGSSSTPAAE